MAEDAEKQPPSTHDILEAEKQKDIDKKVAAIAPYMWKKGQSGNPTLIDFFRHTPAAIDALERFVSEARRHGRAGPRKEFIRGHSGAH